MPIEIHQLTTNIGARMTGIDARKLTPAAEVAAIDAGMNRHAVLVLPDRTSATGSSSPSRAISARSRKAPTRRCALELRLDPARRRVQPRQVGRKLFARDNKRRMAALGNRLATLTPRSASCRPSTRSRAAASSRPRAATPSSPTCARPTMRLDAATKAEVEDLVCGIR